MLNIFVCLCFKPVRLHIFLYNLEFYYTLKQLIIQSYLDFEWLNQLNRRVPAQLAVEHR